MTATPAPVAGTVTYLFSQPAQVPRPPEAAEDVRRAHLQLLRRAVPTSRPVKVLGDGAIVVFQSALEAVGCAQAVQEAAAGPAGGDQAPPRVALHAGQPIADEEQYLSAPITVLQRVCQAAGDGQVVVSSVVRGLVDASPEHSFQPWTQAAADGGGLDWYELEWRAAMPPTAVVDAANARPQVGASQFVGRRDELSALEAAWERARAGERQLLFLTGEPGIGKTTVARHFAASLEAQGATVLFGRCDEEALVPHQPFVEALRHYVLSCPPSRLAQQVGDGGSDLIRLVPELAERLPGLPEPLLRGEHHERYRLYEATGAFLEAIAAAAPLLLVLDDLHWADKPTLLLLRHVLARPEPAAILAVGTYREVGLARTHPLSAFLAELRRHLQFDRLSLRGLDEAEVAALVSRSTGNETPPAFAAALRRHTEGNPFFVQGLLDHLTEHHPDVDWTAGVDLPDVGIPEGVRDLIGRRLSSLDDRTNRVLAVAAVVGVEFELAVLELLGDWSPDDVLDAVEQAAAAGLVVEDARHIGRFHFSHNLVRQTLYDELATVRRVRLHLRVAEAMEAVYAEDIASRLGQLAYHYAEAAAGGAVEKAVSYSAWAAMRATDATAYEEAAAHYHRALQTMEFAEEPDKVHQAELMVSLADVLNRAGDVDQARQIAWRSVGIIRALGDPVRLGRAALLVGNLGYLGGGRAPVAADHERRGLLEEAIEQLGEAEPGLRARLLSRLALELAYTDERTRMAPLTQRAVALARQAGDSVALGSALSVMDSILWGPDQVQDRVAAANELIRLGDESGDRELTLQGFAWRLQAVLEIGDAAAFDDDVTRYQTLARELRQPLFVGYADMFGALRAFLAGDFAEMERLAAEALSEGQRQNELASAYFGAQMFWVWWQQGRLPEVEPALESILSETPAEFPTVQAAMALVCVELGRRDEAVALLDSVARSGFQDLPRDTSWPVTMTLLTPVIAQLGDAERAAMLHRLLLPFSNRVVVVGPPPAGCYGPAAQYLGMLAATMGRAEEAAADLLLARQLSESMGAAAFVAHADCEYGALLAGIPGKLMESTRFLGQAVEAADALGLERMAARARSLRANVPDAP
ncbi:MAG: AAA family ATPase [Acidimicrobiia bacterium]|nr:AAA family ATPase [Acidimicrobiia bacterium]